MARASKREGPPPDPSDITALLHRLAKDDFALVQQDPPLIYHNDLSATVARYYWSEDVRYALWLRLASALQARPR